jgi:Flp pilus assembly protein TadG
MKKFLCFRRDERGAVVIEFAMLAFPFMLIIVAILELSLYFAAASVIQGGVIEAARLIRTGQLQAEADLAAAQQIFRDEVCEQAGAITDCNNFQFDVRKLTSFEADTSAEFDEDGNMTANFESDQLTAGCVALIRVVYPYQFFTPFFGGIWADEFGNSSRRIITTVVLRTEPYDFNEGANCRV